MLLSAVDVAVNVAIARRLYRRSPCCHRRRTINVSISVSFAVPVAVAVAVATTLSNAVAVEVNSYGGKGDAAEYLCHLGEGEQARM